MLQSKMMMTMFIPVKCIRNDWYDIRHKMSTICNACCLFLFQFSILKPCFMICFIFDTHISVVIYSFNIHYNVDITHIIMINLE